MAKEKERVCTFHVKLTEPAAESHDSCVDFALI